MDVPWNCSFPKVSERRWEQVERLAQGFHAVTGILLYVGLCQGAGRGVWGGEWRHHCCEKERVGMWEGNMAGQGFQD